MHRSLSVFPQQQVGPPYSWKVQRQVNTTVDLFFDDLCNQASLRTFRNAASPKCPLPKYPGLQCQQCGWPHTCRSVQRFRHVLVAGAADQIHGARREITPDHIFSTQNRSGKGVVNDMSAQYIEGVVKLKE